VPRHAPPFRPSWSALLLALLVLVLPGPAQAEEQPLVYQLLANDRAIGSRRVTIKYLPTPTGEIRLLEAWTTFVLPIAKGTLRYEQRLGARLGGDRSFASSMATNEHVREVQVHQAVDARWSVSTADTEGAKSWDLDPDAVDLVTPELFDPERALSTLQGSTTMKLMSAETGGILAGSIEALGPATLQIGAAEVEVQRYRFSPPEGVMTLAFSQDGWLVAYDYQVLGILVGARLEKLPPPRTFGTALDAPITTGTVSEETL